MFRVYSEPCNLHKEEDLQKVLKTHQAKWFRLDGRFLEYSDGNPMSDKIWELSEKEVEGLKHLRRQIEERLRNDSRFFFKVLSLR